MQLGGMQLVRDGSVFVLHMRSGENRVNEAFVGQFHEALDEIEASEGEAALVTTGEGKFYSNGLDLEGFAAGTAGDPKLVMDGLDRLFARLLTFPTATAAAINGHAFAAGGMLALAHDFRVMRADRGFFCLPEVDLGMGVPLNRGMYAVIGARLSQKVFHEVLITGRRYGGTDAAAQEIVQVAVPEQEVLPRAIEMVRGLAGKDRATMAALKRGLFRDALEILEA